MGGPVPLGYDARDRRLEVNAAEAETVRRIFAGYLAVGSIRRLLAELRRDGVVTKRRPRRSGQSVGGTGFTAAGLTGLLRNPVYIGEARHKGTRHPGQHEAIVAREVWEAVQARLDAGAQEGRPAVASSPLAGRITDTAGQLLTPSHAAKAGRRYRYYVSRALVTGLAADCPEGMRLPALPVEQAVRRALAGLLGEVGTVAAPAPADAAAEALLRDVRACGKLQETIWRRSPRDST